MTTSILGNEKASRSLSEFDFVYDSKDRPSKLGKGSFANVRLVQEKKTGKLFALKMINVNPSRISRSDLHNLRTEIQIHRQLDHPNIIKFNGYIQDGLNIYLVLDYAQNGNLYNYIHKKKVLTPNEVFHFFYQSCLAIQYLHQKDFVHRDIKPENLLLDQDLNIQVCDFGWSAKSIKEKRITFCGTYEYMAPEIVRKKPYDYRVDIWSLGVLLYELVHREAPYKGRNLAEIANSLSHSTLYFCPTIQPEVKHLIEQILKIDPNERISIAEIMNHPWIKYHLSKQQQNSINNFMTPTKPANPEPARREQDLYASNQNNLMPPQEQLGDDPCPSPFEPQVQPKSARALRNVPTIIIPTLTINFTKLGEGISSMQTSPRGISQISSPMPKVVLRETEYENAPMTPVTPVGKNNENNNKGPSYLSATLPKKMPEKYALDSRKMSNDPGSRKLFEKDIMSPDFNIKLHSILEQLNVCTSARKEKPSENSALSARYNSQQKPLDYNGSISFRGYEMPAARENSIGRQPEPRENGHNATNDLSNTSIDNFKVKYSSENSKPALKVVTNTHASNTALQARADPTQNVYVPTFKINFSSSKYRPETSNKSTFQKHLTLDLNLSSQKVIQPNTTRNNTINFDEMVNSLCKTTRAKDNSTEGYLIQSSSLSDLNKNMLFKGGEKVSIGVPASKNKENRTESSSGRENRVVYDKMYTQC